MKQIEELHLLEYQSSQESTMSTTDLLEVGHDKLVKKGMAAFKKRYQEMVEGEGDGNIADTDKELDGELLLA